MTPNPGESLLMQRRKRKFHVVIVQGIGEDSKSMATGKKVAWLNESILKRYAAGQITKFPNTLDIKGGISFAGISEAAVQLLDQVQNDMELNKASSVLLIGYDIGGLILKQALSTAIRSEKHSSIAEKTSLLVFIGTPHRATDLESWETMFIKLILRRMHGASYSLSKVLEESAKTLMEVSQSFQAVARLYRTVSFYDANDVSPSTLLSFSKGASTMGIPNETSEPVDDDALVRDNFKEDNAKSKFVDFAAKTMWRTKGIEKLYLSCFRTLSMVDYEHGLAGSQPFASNSEAFNWISDHDAYKNWIGSSSRLLWLHGQAESDIAASLCVLEKKALEMFPDANVIRFSFDSRDDRYQSTYRMLASLSHQLLILQPTLFDHVMPLYEKISHEMPWRIDRLWVFFRSLIGCPHKDHGVTLCFVNMIDQCDPSRNQFLDSLLFLPQSEGSTGKFKLAVTRLQAPDSRDAISVNPRGNGDPDENKKKLEKVIDQELRLLLQARPELAIFQDIIKEKLRASGDHFTILLTVALLQARQARSTYAELETQIRSLPHTTPGLYQHFLDKIPMEQLLWSRKVLSWIIYASRPLKLAELTIGLALQDDVPSIPELQSRLPQDLALDLQQTFGNLIKIVNDDVVFVHGGFRDFLLQDRPGPQVSSWIFYFHDHAALAESCLRYISLVAAKRAQSTSEENQDDARMLPNGVEYDFLNYAIRYWPKHYNSAKLEFYQGLHERACSFLKDPKSVQLWSQIRWAIGNPLERPQMSFRKPLPLAVRLGCGDIVGTLLREPDLDREDLPTALEVAIENGDETIIHDLWAADAKSPMELHKAALYGRDHVMCKILKRGVNSKTGERTSTPLHFASTSGYHTFVRRLIEAKFNPNARDEQGLAPLHLASQFGHVGVIDELIVGNAKADLKTDDKMKTATLARMSSTTDDNMKPESPAKIDSETDDSTDVNSSSNAEDDVDTKTKAETINQPDVKTGINVDINIADDNGWTPLHIAIRWQQPNAVMKLLRYGAKIDAVDSSNNIPLHLAAKSGREDIVGKLLSHYETFQIIPGHELDLQNAMKSQNNTKLTPLHLAASEGHTGVVRQLLGKFTRKLEQANTTTMVDISGNTPLHLAAENGHSGVVKALLERGTRLAVAKLFFRHKRDGNSSITITNQQSQVPIHLGVLSGDVSVVTRLCEEHRRQRVSLDIFDFETQSPLHLASRDGLADIVSILLEHRARADIADENAETPLLLACTIGHLEIVKKLLANGADPMCANSRGRSPLHQASAAGAIEVVQELLLSSSKLIKGPGYVNLRDNHGSTPLHLAAENGHVQVMEVLLKENGDFKAVDGNGDSVLTLASRAGYIELVRFLIQRIKDDIKGIDGESPPSGWSLLEVVRALLLEFPDDQTATETKETDNVDGTGSQGQGHTREILMALLEVRDRWDLAQYGSILRLAARKGIFDVVVQILGVEGVDANGIDEENNSALLLAAQYGHSRVVVELLKVPNIDRDMPDMNGRSPISYAAESGYLDIVRSLALGRKSAIDVKIYEAALGFAAEEGHLNIVTFFLDDVTFTQASDFEGAPLDSSLVRAVSGQHDKIVSLLVARGADVNTTKSSKSPPLHLAAQLGATEICSIILRSGKIADINAKNDLGRSALFVAAWHAHSDVVKTLLEFHANTETPEEDGWRPLHAAYDSLAITKILLGKGAEVNSTTFNNETPLFITTTRGYEIVAEELLGNKADPLVATNSRRTPLHEAAVASDDLFRLMLENVDSMEKSPDPKDFEGRGPFSIAAARGRLGVVRALVDREDVDINQKSDDGHTPLWYAIMGGYDGIIVQLLESPRLSLTSSSEISEELLRYAVQNLEDRKILDLLIKRDIHVSCGSDVLFDVAMESENIGLIDLALLKNHNETKLDSHGWSLGWTKYVNTAQENEARIQPEISTLKFLPPTRWSESDEAGFLKIEDDGVTVNSGDPILRRSRRPPPGVVRADHPIPPIGKFSFEIEILEAGGNGITGIGFGHKDAPLEDRMPGWDPPSWGYHGDDGQKFHGKGLGEAYAKTYSKGDVIGCHIDQSRGSASFTKNGKDLGIAFKGITGRLYPMVGTRSPKARVVTRFSWSGTDGDKGERSIPSAIQDKRVEEVENIQTEDEYSASEASS